MESKFVKTKIAAGYALLFAAGLVAALVVYRAVLRNTTPDASYRQLRAKGQMVSETLYRLYEAESYGQMMIAGNASYEARYRREMGRVREAIDSLRRMADPADRAQHLRLDSIARLLGDKERRTMELHRTIREAGAERVLDENIRRLTAIDSAAVRDTLEPARIVSDTVVVRRPRRRFFRRLADLFSPPAEDTSLVVAHNRIVEAMPRQLVQDTISTVLHALQDSVASDRTARYDRAWREGARLRYSNDRIDRTLYRLLLDFEAEDAAYLVGRMSHNEALRMSTARMLGAVAAVAVLLVLAFVTALWRDINRGNRYRRELERANRENEALLHAREQLMLAITHDIKAPLGTLMGYADLLRRLVDNPRACTYLDRMDAAAAHLLALIDSLLDFYRLDSRKAEIRTVAFTPWELFESVRDAFAAAADAKGLALTLEAEPSARREVAGDAFRIRQIADNLLSNAVKFTDRGGIAIRVWMHGGRLVFSVRDTGRGMSREERERIFGEFVRLRSAAGVDGFGLGLSIVERIVRLMGGTISVESSPDVGSRFIVSIPVGEATARQAEAAPTQPVAGLRLLAIDDDRLQLELLATLCRGAGIEVACCADASYAVQLAAEGAFDAVVTDLQMPAMDGCGVLDGLRQAGCAMPVVAVSARGEPDDATLRARGFAAAIRKPFAAEELLATLAAVCGRAAHEEALPAEAAGRESPPATESAAAGVRLEALTAFAAGDAAAAGDILRTFVGQGRENIARVREALRTRDAGALAAAAHRMLPVFQMIGAGRVAAALRRAESGTAWDDAVAEAVREAMETADAIVGEAQKNLPLQENG